MLRWLLALLSLALASCAPRISTGEPCVLNSDCAEPLACVEGRCGSECVVHGDCILGARCVVLAAGVGRCFVDAAPQCDADDPCEFAELTCLNRRCYADCANCPSDGVCVEGLCYRRPDADAGASDAGGLATRTACEPLTPESCGGGTCESAYFAAAVCRAACTTHAECGGASLCVRTNEGSSQHCTIACDPLTSAGCLGSDTCDHLYFQVAETYVPTWECRRAGTLGEGEACRTDQPMGCARGLTCTSESAGEFCRPLCDTDAIDACGAGFRCRALDGSTPIGGRLYGACTVDGG